MTPEQLEIFRLALLRIADANHTRFGLSIPAFRVHLVGYGFREADATIEEALEYLAEKELLDEALKAISRENRAWRITTKGRAYLDGR